MNPVIDAELEAPDPPARPDEPSDAIALRRPDIPVTVNDLAALKQHGIEIIDARIEILETARKAAIRRTWPSDWNLYQAKDGRVTAFLHDAGCERVRDIVGIEIRNVTEPRFVAGENSNDYAIVITGDGFCKFTTQAIEGVMGVRYSTEDFVASLKGIARRMAVTKAARANLNGTIVRQLAALKNVTPSELTDAWQGTSKRVEDCIKARGFGSQAERDGARPRAEGEAAEAPICDVCGAAMAFRPAGTTKSGRAYQAFWSCPQQQKRHPDAKAVMDDAKWREILSQRAAQPRSARQPGDDDGA